MGMLKQACLLVMSRGCPSGPEAAMGAGPADLAAQVQERQREVANITADYRRVSRFVALAGQSAQAGGGLRPADLGPGPGTCA